VNSNIYVLLEALLLVLFFWKQKQIKTRSLFIALVGIIVTTWLIDNFYLHSITKNSTYFRIVYSFIIVFLSINLASHTVYSSDQSVLKDPLFIIAVSFIVYFTYKALIQCFVLYGSSSNTNFLLKIYIIMIYINLATNFLHLLAVLWMPGKPRYTIPFSLQ
jgi:hypothetical protein